LKIGIVTPTYYPYPGGVSEHVHHTYLELKRQGHAVKIITTSFGKRVTEDEKDIIRVGRSIPMLSNGSIARMALPPLFFSGRMKKILDREAFDLLHLHEPLVPPLCLAALRDSKAVNIGTFHAFKEFSLGYAIFSPYLRKYSQKLNGRIAVSDSAKKFVSKTFPGPYRIIPNGIDLDRFKPNGKIKQFDDGTFNILFVGRLEPRKGLKYLLRAFSRIKEKLPRSRLIIVGSGPLERYYRQFAPRHYRSDIFFEGLVSKEKLPSYYSTCDVFCSPATGKESFGIVLLEAMASGKAIVVSDIAGYRNVMTDGQEGLFVKPRQPEEIANAVVKIGSDLSLRARLGANGLQKAREYSWDNIVRQTLRFYAEHIRIAMRA
jgi:phosphatidylinositol alpha-mannosyltransferase